MSGKGVSRRRFLFIGAAACGLPLLPGAARAAEEVMWRGVALGAPGEIRLLHPDRAAARRSLDRALGEIERLERVFSLYRPDSALVRLNQSGRLDAPPLDLVFVLHEARRVSELSGGAFDITVQPLWEAYAAHFAHPHPDPAGPSAEMLEPLRRLIDYRAVSIEPHSVSFAKAGMAATLNGIAQGYVTDRIADILRDQDFRDVLVSLGEARAEGGPTPNAPWRAELPDGRVVELSNAALATSSADGARFSPLCHHLFDPATARSADSPRPVSVRAERAVLADAASTALSILPSAQWDDFAARLGCSVL